MQHRKLIQTHLKSVVSSLEDPLQNLAVDTRKHAAKSPETHYQNKGKTAKNSGRLRGLSAIRCKFPLLWSREVGGYLMFAVQAIVFNLSHGESMNCRAKN